LESFRVKINRIEVLNLKFDYSNRRGFEFAGGTVTGRVTSLVRVVTDDGQVGLGTVYSHPDLVRLIIEEHLAPHLIGEDPSQIERLWQEMYSLTRWYGRKGVAISALGGIDIALWDLRGKVAGKPIYALLGAKRHAVPAYASGLFWHDEVRELEREARRHRDRGFRCVKMRLGRNEVYDRVAFEAARRGVGPDGRVLVDGSHRYTVESAASLGRHLAHGGALWFEEPLPPEDIEGYAVLRGKLEVPLAAGENEFGTQGFKELFRMGAVDVAQPDACRTGGITELLRIADLAADSGVQIASHTWSDAVALMANAHVIAALPHGIIVEVDQTGNPFIDDLLAEPLCIENGLLQLPSAYGLGVELNAAMVDRLRIPQGQLTKPGNYSDLVFRGH
jgi:D-galactarolactone cycloisomerase